MSNKLCKVIVICYMHVVGISDVYIFNFFYFRCCLFFRCSRQTIVKIDGQVSFESRSSCTIERNASVEENSKTIFLVYIEHLFF